LGPIPGAQSIQYGPDGNLYVAAEKIDRVLRFDGQTGVPLGALVADDPATPIDETGGLDAPTAALFGPDGDLYVASFDGDSVLRYDGVTGSFVGVFVTQGSGGLADATFVELAPDPAVGLSRLEPGLAGATNTVRVRGATPGGSVLLGIGLQTASFAIPNCPDAFLGIADPLVLTLFADAAGEASLSAFVDPTARGLTLFVSALDAGKCRFSNLVVTSFP
jgi:hypothetical protein